MSSTIRKEFLQTRTSTAEQRKAYRVARRAASKAYWQSDEGKAEQEKIAAAHAKYLLNATQH